MLKHLVFAECVPLCARQPCADADTQPPCWLPEVFVAMAYGVFPFCVQEDTTAGTLVFRRVALPTDSKDRGQRLKDARGGAFLCACVSSTLGHRERERRLDPRRPPWRPCTPCPRCSATTRPFPTATRSCTCRRAPGGLP